jgi:hypothetical protein
MKVKNPLFGTFPHLLQSQWPRSNIERRPPLSGTRR